MENSKDIKMSEVERIILENIDRQYQWIARDRNGNLHVYDEKPEKGRFCWYYSNGFYGLSAFNHLFKMVKWEDEEPTLIAELTQIRKELQQ